METPRAIDSSVNAPLAVNPPPSRFISLLSNFGCRIPLSSKSEMRRRKVLVPMSIDAMVIDNDDYFMSKGKSNSAF